MLHFATQTFYLKGPISDEARAEVISYATVLVSKGFLARKAWFVCEDEQTLRVGGLACCHDCIARARTDPQISAVLEDLRASNAARHRVRYSKAPGTKDLKYASGPPWAGLTLVCEPILGISPVRTKDGAIVARCRLKLSPDLSEDLWTWDVEYDQVYNSWLVSGDYEAWAAHELSDDASILNQKGVKLAERLAQELSCPVEYVKHDARD